MARYNGLTAKQKNIIKQEFRRGTKFLDIVKLADCSLGSVQHHVNKVKKQLEKEEKALALKFDEIKPYKQVVDDIANILESEALKVLKMEINLDEINATDKLAAKLTLMKQLYASILK